MMGLLIPELLLLAIPATALWWLTRPPSGGLLRALLLALLVLALAGPIVRRPVQGRDVVLVVDRSASMPGQAMERATEIIELLEQSRTPDDRVGVVSVAQLATIERPLSAQARFEGFGERQDSQGSDIGAGLDLALSMIPDKRAGTILLISDGRSTEGSVLPAARRAAARGVDVQTRELSHPLSGQDLSVMRLDLPQALDVGEPFAFSGWVRADREQEADWALTRDGEVLAQGHERFEPGLNRLVFRDALVRAGVGVYRLELQVADDDPQPQNNVGIGAVLAQGSRRVLVLNDGGEASTLSNTLVQAGMEVHVSTPEAMPLTPLSLSHYRSVVLENVDASRLGLSGMSALRSFVETQGGGLLMSGGQASFGVGGYHKSALEPVLPLSLELKQERRKVGMALAIALDRSGSMAVEVAPGVTKMELANDGTAAAIRLLSPIDSISVIAVDSEAHVIVPQSQVQAPQAMAREVARIESMGGGIYTREALVAAEKELLGSPQKNKHLILFTDAADSEQQDGVPEVLKRMTLQGITVSVIALGTKEDSDAQFLMRTARQGDGEIYFTTSPRDLPRLFAMDTLIAARAAWVDIPTASQALPSLVTLGLPSESFPRVDGYNLTWPKPGATVGVQTLDDNAAVVVAWQQSGLGRSAAYTGQIGGVSGASLTRWPGFSSFFVTLVRWTALQEPPQDWHAEVRREGRHGVVSVEVAEGETELPGSLQATLLDPQGEPEQVQLDRVGPRRYQARVLLPPQGVALGSVRIDQETALPLPPLALPHSPEFAHLQDPKGGARALEQVGRLTQGGPLGRVDALWEAPQAGEAGEVLTPLLLIVALVVLLLEIGARRLGMRMPKMPSLPSRRAKVASLKAGGVVGAASGGRSKGDGHPAPAPTTPPPVEPKLESALDRASAKAKKKLDR